ncbi:TonB-dependent receptor [Nguyenibacter vanlangensis]|uniref:TonB-dependent receptor n=1 Tax=Nguyenibacter vanlangensis TaxID=1216886 RepID=A0ABZ3D196_9PROT
MTKMKQASRLLTCLLTTALAVPAMPAWAAAASPGGKTRAPGKARAVAAEALTVSHARTTAHGATVILGRQVLDQFVPGTSAAKMLSRLPGINFVSDDPLGTDSWGSALYMRGFTQQQLGFALDGIPLGAQDFRPYNGLMSTFAISPDNIAAMDVSQGAGALAMPSTTNLGGAVELRSVDPQMTRGGTVSQTFGSNQTYRTFVRLDTGVLNRSGTRMLVSYARADGRKWKGNGDQFDQQVNAKVVQPIAGAGRLTLFFDWNQTMQFAYADQSLAMLKALGTRNDYYWPYYNLAYLAAQGIYQPSLAGFSDAIDVSYYDGVTIAKDYLGGATLQLPLTDRLDWNTVLYGHGQRQWQTWTSPYTPSPNGAPLSEQVIEPRTQRYGFTSALDYQLGINRIEGGLWYENDHYISDEFQYPEPLLGQGEPLDAVNGRFGTPFQENWGMDYWSNTVQTHLQDTIRPTRNLVFNLGFRSLVVTTRGGGVANDVAYNGQETLPYGTLTAANGFLPDFRADWHFLRHHELYLDITKNMRGYGMSGYQLGSAWGVSSQQTFEALKRTIQPETDWVYDLGYRYSGRLLQGSLNLYHVDFSNRLQSLTAGTIIQPISTVINVGGVTMNGLDAALTLTPLRGLAITNSVSYNHAVYDNNITTQGTTYFLKGQQVVNYPRVMYKSNVTYNFHDAQIHFDAAYTSRRNFSYVGDMSVPGFWMASLGARYRFGDYRFLKNITVDFNVYNLFNSSYVSQMGENGNPLSGDYQSVLVGAPRQYFGTISTRF